MVLSNIQFVPSAEWQQTRPMLDPSLIADLQAERLDEALLESVVTQIRQAISGTSGDIEAYRGFNREHVDDPELRELEQASDELLLDRAFHFTRINEKTLDRLTHLNACIAGMDRCRAAGRVWSDDAEAVFTELLEIQTIMDWTVSTLRTWCDVLCDTYESRHPDLPPLPFEPCDLGVTNSAQLPPIS